MSDMTLNATAPDGTPYTEIYGEEDWAERTPAQRQAEIDADLAKARAEAEAEAEAAALQKAEDAEYDARCAALDAAQDQAERLIAQHGMTVSSAYYRGGTSRYLTVSFLDADGYGDAFEVRISNHAQPVGGGYNEDADARHGESDVLLDIRDTPEQNAARLLAAIQQRQEPRP